MKNFVNGDIIKILIHHKGTFPLNDTTQIKRMRLLFSDGAQWGKIEIMRPKIKKIDFFSFRLKLIPHYSKLFVDLSMYNVFVLR